MAMTICEYVRVPTRAEKQPRTGTRRAPGAGETHFTIMSHEHHST